MSKGKKAKYDFTPYIDYANYLKSYDTSNVDNTLSNLTNWASNSSANTLNNMGDYTFNVDGSDAARQRTENALYNSAVDKLTPQFERQQSNLATMLQNQGIPVGSEAYSRAMGDLEEKQNATLQQAAYQSILEGRNAFSQSLGDEVTAGGFGNTAQQAYINQLLSALQGSASGYENQQNLFGVRAGQSNLQYQQDKANAKSGLTGALTGALQGGLSAFAASGGNPFAGLAGAAYGGYSGYNSNPYGSK
jgi:hypothetical protein